MTSWPDHPPLSPMQPGWSASRWRAILFAGIAVVAAIWLWSCVYADRAAVPGVAGSYGIRFGPYERDERIGVRAIEPGSPFEHAGVRPGDHIRFDHRGDARRAVGTDERIGATWYPANGSDGRRVVVQPMADPEVVSHPAAALTTIVLDRGLALIALAICALIAWRQPGSVPLRVFVACWLFTDVDNSLSIMPQGVFRDYVYWYAGPSVSTIGWLCFAAFALTYPAERPLWDRPWIRLAFWIYAAAFAARDALNVAARHGIEPLSATARSIHSDVLHVIAVAVFVLGAFTAWRRSDGVMRQRLSWVGLCMGFIGFAYGLDAFTRLAGLPPSNFAVALAQQCVIAAGLMAMTYALLRRQLFDFGFAFNRLIVYAVVALASGAVAIALQMAGDAWLDLGRRSIRVAFDLGIVVVLVALFPIVRSIAERVVQAVFFPHWRTQEAALDRAIDDAASVQGREALFAH